MDSYIPYQAYRSKRHSRNVSNTLSHFVPNVSPPPLSRPTSVVVSNPPSITPYFPTPNFRREESQEMEKIETDFSQIMSIVPDRTTAPDAVPSQGNKSPPTASSSSTSLDSSSPTIPPSTLEPLVLDTPEPVPSPALDTRPLPSSTVTGKSREFEHEPEPTPPSTSTSTSTSMPSPTLTKPTNSLRKQSTFRHVPRASLASRTALLSSPLRPGSANAQLASPASVHSELPRSPLMHARITSLASTNSTVAEDRHHTIMSFSAPEQPPPTIASNSATSSYTPRVRTLAPPHAPPVTERPLPRVSQPTSATALSSPAASVPPSPSLTPSRSPAPYRPGFQPKGLYRPRTDEFLNARRVNRDVGRIERTKLERRLEKLIHLHFSIEGSEAGTPRRTKGEIRSAEQRITPWQDDASTSKCPLCIAPFHPLTNRKHHCRLCGNIICSLPIKRPQRPEPCCLLFVVDPKTRQIEEVKEGVDYGVRKRKSVDNRSTKEKGNQLAEEEKFLKGVRICRECRPVIIRQQYFQEASHVPTFHRLYDAFIALETEIEGSLPQFRELIMTLTTDEQPTKEATATRKRLLDAFSQYDALSKRIRKLPYPSGSSQDRVQTAILTRANLFLQKNMFPLQSLPKQKKHSSSKSQTSLSAPVIDPDSEMAHALQPLLEQEALLESFVEEALAHRKFEDAKSLKDNLKEVRIEIDNRLAMAESSRSS